jgi:hypothetical protein
MKVCPQLESPAHDKLLASITQLLLLLLLQEWL